MESGGGHLWYFLFSRGVTVVQGVSVMYDITKERYKSRCLLLFFGFLGKFIHELFFVSSLQALPFKPGWIAAPNVW